MRAVLGLLVAGLAAFQAGTPAPSGGRLAGTDMGSGISYVLISTEGRAVASAGAGGAAPRLTAVCTRTPEGKLRFELMADLGGVAEVTYLPPWKPASKYELFPPRLETVQVTMEFLGYTKVKPVKRAWEYLPTMPGELRYQAPGRASPNLEEVSFYMQYLRALPMLRLTIPGKGVAEWETTRWQQDLHAEPICSASRF